MVRLCTTTADSADRFLELSPGVHKVGRSSANNLRLDDPSVSSFHCELVVSEAGIEVRDLGATNGTFIDDQRIQQAPLRPGQRLRLGNVELRCEAPTASSAAPEEGSPRTGEPPVAPPIKPCHHHAGVAAQWRCVRCHSVFCDACLKIRQQGAKVWRLCPVCDGDCQSLSGPPATPERMSAPIERTFFQKLPEAFAYPFAQGGVLLLIGGTLLLWASSTASKVAIFVGLFGLIASLTVTIFCAGYLCAYLQRILASSAQGEDRLPTWPDFTDWSNDILRPVLMVAFTCLVCFTPWIGYLIAVACRVAEPLRVVTYPLLALGLLYLPMAWLAVALTDNFFALNPLVVLPSIARIPGPYAVTVVLCAVLTAAWFYSETVLGMLLPIPVLPGLLAHFAGLYLLVVQMRVLGLLYHAYRQRLGWFAT